MDTLSNSCASMLQELKTTNKQIESVVNKHIAHSSSSNKATDAFQTQVNEIERLEQEISYKLWINTIESHR